MEIRSFLAFDLPAEIKNTIARVLGEMKKTPLDVKWVKADNIHLTTVFMGNIQVESMKDIGEEIRLVCLRYGPFDIALRGMGLFPGRSSPRVLWLGLTGDLERLAQFRDDLQGALRSFGIKQEKRKFKPHLTLGRFRRSRRGKTQLNDLLWNYNDLKSPVCSLEELALYKSELKASGAEYTRLDSWSLTGQD
ncbi:RNA 2',3'-cyclic phosphodiesterase [Thermodesulfobacteriota bacterium]